MNHSFIPSAWNKSICAKCAKSEPVHLDLVSCESCETVGKLELIDGMLLCAACFDAHQAAKSTESIKTVIISETEKLVCQINALANSNSLRAITDEAITGGMQEYTDFFNASTISIIELEQLINDDETISEKKFALAEVLNQRIKHFALKLVGIKKEQIECAAQVKSIQQYMNEVIPNLRKEIREQYARENPNFVPQVIKESKTRVKKDKVDKLAESMAKLLKISVEEAKRKIENKTKDECSCSETPGICRIHK